MRLTTRLLRQIDAIRNIGILAHIDAGKTTTTERMLFYSGTIRTMGEVHHGNTVTDYMDQERRRGITIRSAAVSFGWKDRQINLIDTPGHIDFTMEVEQSLGVLDGAVVILDGSAGVEAQTLTVWRQCDNYNLPRLIYVNKMDRNDASMEMCLESIRQKLDIDPVCLHLPVTNDEGKLNGIVDIVNVDSIVWDIANRGVRYNRRKLTEEKDPELWEKALEMRRNLTDTLSAHDDTLAETIISSDSLDDISSTCINDALREATLNHKVFPVLCGSSYKNIGVQLLMDAVIDYLPPPSRRNQFYDCFDKNLCAKAFKVLHDNQKGVLTFFRIFSGKMTKNQKFYNIAKDKNEQGGILYVPYADEYSNTPEVSNGNVAVISDLKNTMVGDLVTLSQTAASKAKQNLIKSLSSKKDALRLPPYLLNKISEDSPNPEELASSILGFATVVPDPVFVCSIEPPSMAYQSALDKALSELQREDPSLRVTHNSDTGQIVLSGMGELHLDIIKERIHKEYKVNAELGPLQIAYKETINSHLTDTHTIENKIGNSKQSVKVTLSAYNLDSQKKKDILKLDTSPENAANTSTIHPRHLNAVKQGIESAMLHGPQTGCPIINVGVTLHWLEIGRGTSDTFLAAAVTQCLKKIFLASDSSLLEPIMSLEIVCPAEYSSRVLGDLAKRRVCIEHVELRGKNKVIRCYTPLSEMTGYSTDIRTLTSGTATFTMEFHTNQELTSFEKEKAITRIRGF